MGAIEIENTHVKRSSSMTFALRWKHENLRMINLIAVGSFALTLMFFMLLYGTATKSVSVVLNGKETTVHTKQWNLQRLLDEQAISIGEYDRISTPLDTKIKSGDKFTINFTSPIQLTADGETKTLYTTGKTVTSALQDLSIAVGTDDKVSPSPESELSINAAIKVVRVKKELEEQTLPVAFETEKKNDSSLLKGKEQVVQEGQEGTRLVKKEKVFEDGSLVAENVVDESIQAASINKVVAIGTKSPVVVLSNSTPNEDQVLKNGLSFGYKQIINNVTLTAYSAGAASTGKSIGNAQYGITASGTTVTEGRTIAVDKNIIPMGWWVYIDGIGFRRAEDTGSAVKGNLIDVYYESSDYASRFGMKRGHTVYVIGPKKPSAE